MCLNFNLKVMLFGLNTKTTKQIISYFFIQWVLDRKIVLLSLYY